MSGTNPTYQRSVRPSGPGGVVQMPSTLNLGLANAGGLSAITQGFDQLSATLSGIAATEGREARRQQEETEVARARQEAQTASLRDPEGNLIFREPGDLSTPAGRAAAVAMQQRYDDEWTTNVTNGMAGLRLSTMNDPQAVRAALREYETKALAAVPEHYRGRAATILGRETARQAADAQRRFDERNRGLEAAAFNAGLQRDLNEVYGYEGAGQGDTPEAQQAVDRLSDRLTNGVDAQHLTPSMATLIATDANNGRAALRIAAEAEAVARRDGVRAGQAVLEERLRSPDAAALGQQSQNAARAEGMRRLGVIQQDQQFQLGELQTRVSTRVTNLRAGIGSGAADWEENAQQADRLGRPDMARNLRAYGQLQQEIISTTRMPLPEIIQAVGRAQQAPGDDPVAAVRLQELRQIASARTQALREDPVAFADTQSSVVPLLQARADAQKRLADGQGTLEEVNRAQAALTAGRDAVLRANGVPAEFSRAMSSSEASRVVEAVKSAPIDVATATLTTALTAQPAGAARWRVWQDLRAANLPSHLRPITLLLASPGGAAAALNYQAAVRDGADAPNRLLTEDRRRQVGEYVDKDLADIMPTFTGTGADRDLQETMVQGTRTLALFYAASMEPREAVRRARMEMVDGSVEVVRWDNARLRIPRGVQFDRPEFQQGLTAMARSLDEVQLVIPPKAVSADLTPQQAQEAYRASLRTSSGWRNTQDSMGAQLHDNMGQPVRFISGGQEVPFRLMFNENPRDPPVLRQGGNFTVVRAQAVTAGLDPAWVGRITSVESQGEAGRTSPKGALGLMQVMPDTGEEVARKLGIPFDRNRLLNDPEYNARIGTAYLAELSRDPRFRGDRTLITAAYNAGPGRVAAWLDGGRESLPAETMDYVGKVLGVNGRAELARARSRQGYGFTPLPSDQGADATPFIGGTDPAAIRRDNATAARMREEIDRSGLPEEEKQRRLRELSLRRASAQNGMAANAVGTGNPEWARGVPGARG